MTQDIRGTFNNLSYEQDSRVLIGPLIGYCLLASHAFNIGLTVDNKCRKCKEYVEPVEHVTCECPAFGKQRICILDADRLEDLQSAMVRWPVLEKNSRALHTGDIA